MTPRTTASQAPLSIEFPRQEYWRGLSFPSPGIFPTQGSNPCLLHCGQFLYRWDTREAQTSRIFQFKLYNEWHLLEARCITINHNGMGAEPHESRRCVSLIPHELPCLRHKWHSANTVWMNKGIYGQGPMRAVKPKCQDEARLRAFLPPPNMWQAMLKFKCFLTYKNATSLKTLTWLPKKKGRRKWEEGWWEKRKKSNVEVTQNEQQKRDEELDREREPRSRKRTKS